MHYWDWEAHHEEDSETISKCVVAHTDAFALAAGLLIDWCLSFPDVSLTSDLNRLLTIPADQYTRRDRILQIARQLMKPDDDCGDDMAFQLRVNPTDACLVEQSLDGGMTWIAAFDLNGCSTTQLANQTVINNYLASEIDRSKTFIENVYNTYAGDVTNIYPEAEYDGGGSPTDDLRDVALCYALRRAVDVVCDGVIAAIDQASGQVGLTLLAIGAGVGLFVLATIASGGTLAVAAAAAGASGASATGLILSGIGAGSAVAAWMNSVITTHNKDPFLDLAARDEVVCYLYDALKGQTLSAALYGDALDNHTLFGHAQVIADVMDAANEIPENFAGFANLAAQSFAAANVGIISEIDCPCNEQPNIVLVNTYLSIDAQPVFLYNTEDGGSVWECTFADTSPTFSIPCRAMVGGSFVSFNLISATPATNYQHIKAGQYPNLVTGSGDGSGESPLDYLGLFNSSIAVCTIEIEPV